MGRPKLEISPTRSPSSPAWGPRTSTSPGSSAAPRSTIRERFEEELARGHAEQRIMLRRWQWKAAEGGNVAMLIWLGKQYLGQSDKLETKNQVGPVVDRETQLAMLSSERAFDLACDLEEEIIRARHREGTRRGGTVPRAPGRLTRSPLCYTFRVAPLGATPPMGIEFRRDRAYLLPQGRGGRPGRLGVCGGAGARPGRDGAGRGRARRAGRGGCRLAGGAGADGGARSGPPSPTAIGSRRRSGRC